MVDLRNVAQRRGSAPDIQPDTKKHLKVTIELALASAGFRRSLPDQIVTSLSALVRAMNCYYSHLIEGHETHPVDIERALKNDYSKDKTKRSLQLEAKAHITVQSWIDDGGLDGGRAITAAGACEIHRRFCEQLPDELLISLIPKAAKRLRWFPAGSERVM